MITKAKVRVKGWFAPEKRALLMRYWLLATLLYDITRATVVSMLFSKHGVSGVVYFVYELCFSAIFGICSLRLAFSIADKDRRKAFAYGILTFISFFAPDAYIVIKGRSIPAGTYLLLALYLSITTLITVRSIYRDAASKRV